jgi:hypothetical protein
MLTKNADNHEGKLLWHRVLLVQSSVTHLSTNSFIRPFQLPQQASLWPTVTAIFVKFKLVVARTPTNFASSRFWKRL